MVVKIPYPYPPIDDGLDSIPAQKEFFFCRISAPFRRLIELIERRNLYTFFVPIRGFLMHSVPVPLAIKELAMESIKGRLDSILDIYSAFVVGGRIVMWGRDCTSDLYRLHIKGSQGAVGHRLVLCESLAGAEARGASVDAINACRDFINKK